MEETGKKEVIALNNFENSYDNFLSRLREHEISTITKYVLVRAPKNFLENKAIPTSNQRLHWQNDVPYYHFGSRIYHCHQGRDSNICKKRKYTEERDRQALEDHSFTKRYKKAQVTKKLGCPAKILVTRIIRMPELKLPELSKPYQKRKIAELLKMKIENGESFGEEGFMFNLPTIEEHKNHFIGDSAAITEPVDSQVRHYISQLITTRDPVLDIDEVASMTQYKELPLRGSNRKHLINDCNAILRSLQSVLWNLEEEELQHLNANLKDIFKSVSAKVSTDKGNGLPVESETSVKSRINGIPEQKNKYRCRNLAIRKKKTSTKRVGFVTDTIEEAKTLNIEEKIPTDATGRKSYSCYCCGKHFIHQTKLIKHVRLHTGERPYQCSYCTKRFLQLSSLKRHKRMHTGVKSLTHICRDSFAQDTHLHKEGLSSTDKNILKINYQNDVMITDSVSGNKVNVTEDQCKTDSFKHIGVPLLFCTKSGTIIKRLD